MPENENKDEALLFVKVKPNLLKVIPDENSNIELTITILTPAQIEEADKNLAEASAKENA